MHFDPSLPDEIVGDLGRLRQVIVNLVGNAIKFTNDGHVFFSAQARKQTSESVLIEFTVVDTGVGIPVESQQKIFREFEQVDSSTTREFGGTGLGLAISSKIVEMMGGKLQVKSSPGIGSRFSFEATFYKAAAANAPENNDTPFIGKSVLVATGNQLLSESLQQQLAWHRMIVGSVTDLDQARRLLIQHCQDGSPVEILVLDSTMPEAKPLLQWLVDRTEIEIPKLVLLTSSARMDSISIPDGLDVVQQILKPVKSSDLKNAFAAAVHGSETETKPITTDAPSKCNRKLNILLVEDNIINQKVAMALLANNGHKVILACNGAEAVALFKQGDFDLVLMDIQMPVMDGFEATMKIRDYEGSQSGLPETPIIALTAYASSADRERCLAAGMNEYISKPIRASALHRLIEQQTGSLSGESQQGSEVSTRSQIIDWNSAFETVGGHRPLLVELIEVFLQEKEGMLNTLKQAIDSNDDQNIRISAHSLKGALGHLGALTASETARQLETLATSSPIESDVCHAHYSKLNDLVASVSSEFETFVNGSD